MVHRVPREQNRPDHDHRGGHRVPPTDAAHGRRPLGAGNNGRPRRRAVVHRDDVPTKSGGSRPPENCSEFLLPTPNSRPFGITAGPDGAVWFTEREHGGKIGRIGQTDEDSTEHIQTTEEISTTEEIPTTEDTSRHFHWEGGALYLEIAGFVCAIIIARAIEATCILRSGWDFAKLSRTTGTTVLKPGPSQNIPEPGSVARSHSRLS